MASRAHLGIVGIGGAVWLVLSVRTVREEEVEVEVEARLVIEADCKKKLVERRLFVLLSSPFSLVVKDDVPEMIDRRFAML